MSTAQIVYSACVYMYETDNFRKYKTFKTIIENNINWLDTDKRWDFQFIELKHHKWISLNI